MSSDGVRPRSGRCRPRSRPAVLDSRSRTRLEPLRVHGREVVPLPVMLRRRARARRSAGAAILGRALSLLAFLPVASRAPIYARLIWALVRDERVPMERKAVLAAGAGYLLLGRDLVPDSVPVIGGIDDLVVVVLAVNLFLDGVPVEIVDEKLDELGIDPISFHRDVGQIRRIVPIPIRRAVRDLPRAAAAIVDAAGELGVADRVRSTFIKEDPFA